jgi:hypothetical protein
VVKILLDLAHRGGSCLARPIEGSLRPHLPWQSFTPEVPLLVPLELGVVQGSSVVRCSTGDARVLNVHQSGSKGLRERRRTSLKLLVRGSRPRRPTKGLLGVGVRALCCANYGSAPTLTKELTTCDRGRDGARMADPVALPGGRPPGRSRPTSVAIPFARAPRQVARTTPPCFALPRCHPRREGHQDRARSVSRSVQGLCGQGSTDA